MSQRSDPTDFDLDEWQRRCAELAKGGHCPDWLFSCLGGLGRLAPEILATEENEAGPAFDMTYPH